ncbi:MAG TPA: low-complexity tail membrane protein [Candidatus Caenarcaniphilales bacterium]
MGFHWSERFLWIHVAGLAVLPITLAICLLGLAVGDPVFPTWLELLLVGGVGIAPILYMQWQRPFYIFSILVVALNPEQLTLDQQRLLSLFKAKEARLWTVLATLVSVLALGMLYQLAPIAGGNPGLPLGGRSFGLLVAAGAFLFSNLFFQVPLSALRLLLVKEDRIVATVPYPVNQIKQNFTLLGLQVKQILPSPEIQCASSTSSPEPPVETQSTAPAGTITHRETAPEQSQQ